MSLLKLTDDFKVNQAEQFLESFSETDKAFYYMFFGRHIPWTNGAVPDVEVSAQVTDIDTYNHMIFAKRIADTDVCLSIPRIDWVTGVVYTQYDHRTVDLKSENFYVGVLEGDNYNVFKCLYNNNGAVSTVAPSFAAFSLVETADTETYDGFYETADGYQWKYMYTAGDVAFTKFASNSYVPLIANTEVSDFAVGGAIDVVQIETAGSGYNNFFAGEFALGSDIGYLGNTTYFGVRTANNVSPSAANGFYTGCIMKITAGRGMGQFRTVTDYINNGSARYVILDDAFTILPDTTSTFEISPKVTILGRATANAVGRAILGTGNSVIQVEMLDRGAGYFTASAVIEQSNVAVESNTAVLVPIIPPKGGHGFNQTTELGAHWVTISTTVTGSENGVIPTGQHFAQVGIIKDPMFSNVELTTVKYSNNATAGRDGGFVEGETIIVFDPVRQAGSVSVVSGNTFVVSTNTTLLSMDAHIFPHDRAFVCAANGSEWFVSTIVSSNATHLVMQESCPFTDNAAILHKSYSNTSAIHVESGPTYSYVTNATPFFANNDSIIGLTTYSTAVITAMEINNNTINDFNVVKQLSSIAISSPLSTFTADEYLVDADGVNACYFHSYANASHIYVTGVIGDMAAGTILRNPTASASIVVANKYNGELVPESGSVIYVENHEPVSRETSTTQTKKITVEF